LAKKKEYPYEWTKRRAANLFSNVSSWQIDVNEKVYVKEGTWPIKKLLAIEWFIQPFITISRKSPFKEWNYIDMFAGSGLLKISQKGFKKEYLCTGSALLPFFLADEYQFTDYYFFDSYSPNVNALNSRIDFLHPSMPSNIRIHKAEALNFEASTIKLFGSDGIISKNSLSFLVIDPEGLQVTWDLLKTILCNGRVDLIMTVMTYALALNHANAIKDHTSSYARTITNFFGDEGWRKMKNSKELLEYYCDKIGELGYRTKLIRVSRIGESKIYDLILATKNPSVNNIFGELSDRMDKVTPDLLRAAVGFNTKEQSDLDSWF
jgi:three-Cys-motif partner protein